VLHERAQSLWLSVAWEGVNLHLRTSGVSPRGLFGVSALVLSWWVSPVDRLCRRRQTLPTDPPSERPNASVGSSDDDGAGDLGDKVSTFGVDVADLSDAELERQAEAYLRRGEDRYKERAEAYLGFDRGDVVDGDRGDRREVDRGGD